jgi:PAS domain S-box-containing protein
MSSPGDDDLMRLAGAMRSLEDAETLLAALDMAALTVWVIDVAGQRIRFNRHGHDLQAFAPGADWIPLERMRTTIHPEDRQGIVDAAVQAIEQGGVVDAVARYARAGGGWRSLLTRRTAARDAQGRVTHLLGVSIDISELVIERQRAADLDRRLSEVSEVLAFGQWRRHVGEDAHEWDGGMFRVYGLDPAGGPLSLSRWLSQCLHPLDRERVRAEVRRADALSLPVQEMHYRIVRPNGEVRHVHDWSRRELREGRWVVYGVHLDVTERQQVEAALANERALTEFAMAAAGVGVWQRALDGTPLYWNDTMYRLRGLDPGDPRPLELLQEICITPEDAAMMNRRLHEHVAGRGAYDGELRVRWPDGTLHWVATRGRLVRDADGRPLHLAGINFDIDERKRAEALIADKQRAEQASRAKSEFMARISHELRTPLNAVLGFVQLLNEDPQDAPTPRQRERLSRIHLAGSHLLDLINDVLDQSTLDADPRPLPVQGVPLGPLLAEVADWTLPLAERRGLRVELPPPAVLERVTVLADRRRLGQVLLNLLGNAIKYNRPAGEVRLTVRTDGLGLWISVHDTGPGLDAEQLQQVFEPFNRAWASDTRIEGSGLGLSLVRQLTERMGGQVHATSRPGEGSVFSVWLPAPPPTAPRPAADLTPRPPAVHDAVRSDPADAAPPQHDAPLTASRAAPGTPPDEARLRVLCVEDNPVNLLLVQELVALRPAVRLWSAVDGTEGLTLARAERPHVVLLDLQLPDLHGREVLRRLREDPVTAGATVIALSANAMAEDIAAARAEGFDDYWTKPLDFHRFLASLDALVARLGTATPDARA